MTIGYYAIPAPVPQVRKRGPAPRAPWPFCRACVAQQQLERVAPISEDQSPSLTCRGCKLKLRAWR